MSITTQEMFEKVVTHLLTQKKQAMNVMPGSGNTGCAYRGVDGSKCAVGCLISDEHYESTLENASVWNRAVSDALEVSLGRAITKDEVRILSDLQALHDNDECFPTETADYSSEHYGKFTDILYEVSSGYGLDTSFVEKLNARP